VDSLQRLPQLPPFPARGFHGNWLIHIASRHPLYARCRCSPPGQAEKRTHDCVRHRTTALFAGTRDRHRPRRRSMQPTAPAPRVPDLPAPPRPRLPCKGLARSEPQNPYPLHPNLSIIRTPSHPPRRVSLRPIPHDQDPGLDQRMERPLPTVRLDKDRRPNPDEANRKMTQLQSTRSDRKPVSPPSRLKRLILLASLRIITIR
jgi:hypothetical protein